ncbi:heavy-metal-associated domain-containing protein [Jannaschia sp. W003]|uniref:heavy-metal-associated domain-containing protein n=1 Tax=Jannaschia sp. W003 TaxID=2867012 RepID=UPI0021A5E9BC|nr:hypothetical protein [Jannaschia sp. W003]UWQ20092.1 hypothetical protein K3554_08730 [Jannaschia sp. W003]
MKTLLPAAALILSAGGAIAAEATARIAVSGLTCPSCGYVVATTMRRIETVEIVDFAEGAGGTGTYVLRYDDGATDPEAILSAVAGIGYAAALVPESGS